MDPRFIQLGNRVIAVAHIVYVHLDIDYSFSGHSSHSVALYLDNREEPLLFPHGSLSAKALAEWSTAMMRTTCLVDPPSSPPSLSE